MHMCILYTNIAWASCAWCIDDFFCQIPNLHIVVGLHIICNARQTLPPSPLHSSYCILHPATCSLSFSVLKVTQTHYNIFCKCSTIFFEPLQYFRSSFVGYGVCMLDLREINQPQHSLLTTSQSILNIHNL